MNEARPTISAARDTDTEPDGPLVLALDDPTASLGRVGGKGALLARLAPACFVFARLFLKSVERA